MPTPPDTNTYQSPFGGTMMNQAMPFSGIPSGGSPWGGLSPASMGQSPYGLAQFMQGQGYRQQGSDFVRFSSDGGTRYAMSQSAAQRLNAPGPGMQGAQAAFDDYARMDSELALQNQRRDAELGFKQNQRARMDLDRQGALQGIQDATDLARDELKEIADGDFETFAKYRDKVTARSTKRFGQVNEAFKAAEDGWNRDSMASISAAAGGIAKSVEADAQNLARQLSAQGVSQERITALTQQMKYDGSQRIHGQVAQLQDQRDTMMAQLRSQRAQGLQQAAAVEGQTYNQAMMATESALQRRTAQRTMAANMLQSAAMQRAQTDLQYQQLSLELGNQIASHLSGLTRKFPSIYDTILQANFAQSRGAQPFSPMTA